MPLKVLTALDHAKTQYYHYKAIAIAGMGLFTDAYDLFSIIPVMKIMGRVYYPPDDDLGRPGVIPPAVVSAAVGIALVGTVVGQLVFGALGDRVGRRKVYGFSLLMMVVGSVASGFSICRTRKCVLTSLCFFRFWVGVGIGGDYPLSATIMSEFANKTTRGSFIAAVFSMQGFGILASSAVTIVLSAIFDRARSKGSSARMNGPVLDTPEAADVLWRVILMVGAIPAAFTFYWRMGMPETARFTALVENDVKKANNDIGTFLGQPDLYTINEGEEEESEINNIRTMALHNIRYGFFSRQFFKEHGLHLFGCAVTWMMVDIPFYGSTLFQSKIYDSLLKPEKDVNVYQEAFNVATLQAIVAVAFTIPGYWATVYFIDRVGRRKIQMMGFFVMAVLLFAAAGPYENHHDEWWFMVLYGLTFFFSNFGPNTTTFIVPAELFPARFRSTCHGISGAAGKVGAIIGTIGFLWASQIISRDVVVVSAGKEVVVDRGTYWKRGGIGVKYALVMLGVICLVGMATTYLFTPETNGRSLEDNESSSSSIGGGHRVDDQPNIEEMEMETVIT